MTQEEIQEILNDEFGFSIALVDFKNKASKRLYSLHLKSKILRLEEISAKLRVFANISSNADKNSATIICLETVEEYIKIDKSELLKLEKE